MAQRKKSKPNSVKGGRRSSRTSGRIRARDWHKSWRMYVEARDEMKCEISDCDGEQYGGYKQCSPCRNSIVRYGLTTPQRKIMLQEQGGKCAICELEIKFDGRRSHAEGPMVDHCHTTGKIREVLCGRCNMAIGAIEFLGKPEFVLERMKEYLTKHRTLS